MFIFLFICLFFYFNLGAMVTPVPTSIDVDIDPFLCLCFDDLHAFFRYWNTPIFPYQIVLTFISFFFHAAG